MSDETNEWESTSASGNVWNVTKDENGDPKEVGTVGTPEDILDGYYVGLKENVGQNSSNVYSIRKKDGEVMEVWGCKSLNDEMAKVRFGQFIRIQWHGKLLTKAGALVSPKQRTSLHSFHKYEVFISKKVEPTTDLKGLSATSSAGTSNIFAEKNAVANGGPGIQKNNTIAQEEDLPF